MIDVSIWAAFLSGMAFFFSPCVWPMYPSYLSYIAGSGAGLAEREVPRRLVLLWRALGFVLGFSLVFVALGATASSVGQALLVNLPVLRKAAGVLIVLFGVVVAGWVRVPLLERAWQPLADRWEPGRSGSFLGAAMLGGAFSLGWTPCVGPVLAAILAYASVQASLAKGVVLLAAYSAGMAVPFLILAAGFDWLWPRARGLRRFLPAIQKAAGVLLIVLGVLVFGDWMTQISAKLFYFFQ